MGYGIEEARPLSDRTPEKDLERVTRFSNLMLEKWLKGRERHGVTKAIRNPLVEAQSECLDLANYAMETFYRLEKLKERVDELSREENRGGKTAC